MTNEILWVEPSPTDRDLIQEALKRRHLETHIGFARGRDDALELLAKSDPRLVVLALNGQAHDCLELLHEIRRHHSTRATSVLIFGASGSPAEMAACQGMGVEDILQKPVEWDPFCHAVQAIVQRLGDGGARA